VMFVGVRRPGAASAPTAEEAAQCAALAQRVQQAETARLAALHRHLGELRQIIDEREAKRKANPGQTLRSRGWRAMKTMVGTAAKRNEELCTRIAKQIAATPLFLNDARPVCVDVQSEAGRETLRTAVSECLSSFPHVGAKIPASYLALQQLFEKQQVHSPLSLPRKPL
jgi:sirohydrochlorin ferrochelatase